MKPEQLQKFYNMAEPRSEEAIRKAEERKTKRKDKELLLKDLCARLAYGVYVKDINQGTKVCKIHEMKPSNTYCLTLIPMSDSYYYQVYSCDIDSVRPYLRPLSSMPEEEREFLNKIALENSLKCIEEEDPEKVFLLRVKHDAEELVYLYEHHYDVFGLIPAGLAISTETFNPYND